MQDQVIYQKLEETLYSIINRYNQFEKIPYSYGTETKLFAAEIHFINLIGHNDKRNVTQLAEILGVTKGAVSQLVKKLETIELVEKYKSPDNAKEVLIRLTNKGRKALYAHEELHDKFGREMANMYSEISADQATFLLTAFSMMDSFMEDMVCELKQLAESEMN